MTCRHGYEVDVISGVIVQQGFYVAEEPPMYDAGHYGI